MIRAILLSLVLALSTALPGAAQTISLDALSRYLNSFQTADGKFTQINSDGTISTGQVFIKRPGRVRFEYDPPNKTLVIAGGGTVAIFDGKSQTMPEQFPLSQTPLNLILQQNVNFSRAKMVVGHSSDGNSTTVVAQDPDHPEYGNIRLVFTDDPVELRQWIITDSAGERTTVILGTLEKGSALGDGMFSIQHESNRRKGR
ncbi:outer membrane lipoprotein carrier protein LolA [Tropicimonas sp. IMCC34043]|uniref:LolA family protein n=1 Tax=Tropicimonas sp. IMCC34043 TaxID=2248760 RepID=UPI000E2677C3|nr:outer membrane lipoprotein carrier protein LolA [Tropicimonas sp. IMCC34043]